MDSKESIKKEKKKKKTIKLSLKERTLRKRNVLSLFATILLIILLVMIFIMDVLPLKYSLLVTFGLLFLNSLGIVFINVNKKIILKFLGTIIMTITIVGSIFGIYYLNITNTFINKSFVSNAIYTKNTYYVLSKKNSNLKESDIAGKISTYSETTNLEKAIERLSSKYNISEKRNADIGEMFQDVNSNLTSFMLIEKSSYEIVFSIDSNLKKDEYTIINEFDIYTKKEKSREVNSNKFNIYIGGTDFAGLMDFNMIVTVNTKTHEVILTSIPRDYYIEVAGKNGRSDKLSFMSAYGSETTKKSLEKVFDITIDYTLLVDTTSLVKIVDYVDGIEFCSDYAYTTTHDLVNNTYNDKGPKLKVTKGCQHLDGIAALTVARERNAFPGRDRVRQENCQRILVAIFKKLINTDTLLHYNETLNTISSLYETDIPKEVITNIAKDILSNGNNWDIKTQAVNGVDGHDKVHLSNMTDWVMYPDQNTVITASNQIKEVLN